MNLVIQLVLGKRLTNFNQVTAVINCTSKYLTRKQGFQIYTECPHSLHQILNNLQTDSTSLSHVQLLRKVL